MNNHKITLAITTYNRTELLFQAIENVLNHPIIGEILIVDDCSNIDITNQIIKYYKDVQNVNVKRNDRNLGCYHNKKHTIEQASNQWVIIFDSDNIISTDYLDRVESLMTAGLNPKVVYQPSWAKPYFDFTQFSGQFFARNNVPAFASSDVFCTMLNAMNYLVNRDEYLRCWENRTEPWTADSILQAYNWFRHGNSFYVVPELSYEHRVHDGSHYKEHNHKTGNLYNEIREKLKRL